MKNTKQQRWIIYCPHTLRDVVALEGRGFDFRSSRHVGTLGKSFTYSCMCASAWNSDAVSVL